MSDEMQSDSRNDITGRVNGEKVKKKKKRKKSETPEQRELTQSAKVQTEKQREKVKKKKKKKELENISLQTPTDKKKKRKPNEGVEVVTSLHKVKEKAAESQEPQGSREQKPAKKKKKRADVTQADCDDMTQGEQPVLMTEHEEVPHKKKDQESGLPAVLIGTRKRKRKGAMLDEPEVDPNLLSELKEFCPEIESRSSHDINKMIMYDLPRFKEFRKQGIMLRHGRYSNAENERLRQNVRDFLALTGVKDAIKLFHPKRFPEETQELTKLKKVYKFFERIAEGIPRPCHNVFGRGRKVFDGENYKGRFTEEEVKSLLKYHTLHGNNWQKISEMTGRSSYSLEKRFTQLNTARKSGPWSTKEVQRLLRAVRGHIVTVLKSESPNKTTPKRVSREILYQKLPWFNISLKVKTRCWSKCREKWMSILAVQMSSGTCRGRKSQEAKIRLIKAMYQMQVEDVTDVNWDDLTAVFGDVPPAYVQAKWHHLKVCCVPDWKTKCFGDIVDFLYEKVLPGMVKDCEDLDDNELKVDQKQSFLLSDIFKDINEESGQKEDDNSS
ncbi:transcription termination factor 1-like [Sinocyclocheilus grahami]|uniref:Transcription termination factor 1-like n=1 Tax=Sinocyclocheilus grahami TaxID=75366 RepID=A0A672NVL1_SINGR|nr:PREDICTED: transcription termination factor 1-like [Sinocyclocheilus grahami]XP_016131014.1 PREDICTED: transcription termination factor 1-like [Sinocyclocheilus grahami]XP_016131015.1 PREDICTED: transcription termination factor 1-like [Sinocyclocheilus grahami]